MIDWSAILKKSLGFCWRPRRWLPFFILYLACSLLSALYLFFNMEDFLTMLTIISLGNTAYLPNLLAFLAPIFLIIIACFLFDLWIEGSLIHQSYREKEFRQGFAVSRKRYPSLLAATIVIGVVSYLVGLSYMPEETAFASYLGVLLSFIAAAILYFPLQIIIVRSQGFRNALVGSWQLFRDQAREKLISRRSLLLLVLVSEVVSVPILLMPSYLTIYNAAYCWIFSWFIIFAFLFLIVFSRVCDAMILVSIISLAIVLIFSIPFLVILGNILAIIRASYIMGSAIVLTWLQSIIGQSLLPLAASGAVLLVGLSIAKSFSIKAKTEFYLKFRKRILGLI